MFNRKDVFSLMTMIALMSLPFTASQAEDAVAVVPPADNTANVGATQDPNHAVTPVQTPESGTVQSQEQTVAPSTAPIPVQSSLQPTTVAKTGSPDVAIPDIPQGDIGQRVAEINERMALLSAQLAELELKAKIASTVAQIADIGNKDKKDKKKDENATLSPAGGSWNSTPSALPSQNVSKYLPSMRVGTSMPVVKAIEGVDGRLKAVLQVRGEGTRTVRIGETVAGWTIRDIKVDSVTVQKGKTTRELYFGASNNDDGGTLSVPSAGSIPSMPSLGNSGSNSMGIEPLVYKE